MERRNLMAADKQERRIAPAPTAPARGRGDRGAARRGREDLWLIGDAVLVFELPVDCGPTRGWRQSPPDYGVVEAVRGVEVDVRIQVRAGHETITTDLSRIVPAPPNTRPLRAAGARHDEERGGPR